MSSELEEIKRIVESHKEEKQDWDFLREKLKEKYNYFFANVHFYNHLFSETRTLPKNIFEEELYYGAIKEIMEDHSESEIMKAVRKINYVAMLVLLFIGWAEYISAKPIKDLQIENFVDLYFYEEENTFRVYFKIKDSRKKIIISSLSSKKFDWEIKNISSLELAINYNTGKAMYGLGIAKLKELTREWLETKSILFY